MLHQDGWWQMSKVKSHMSTGTTVPGSVRHSFKEKATLLMSPEEYKELCKSAEGKDQTGNQDLYILKNTGTKKVILGQ